MRMIVLFVVILAGCEDDRARTIRYAKEHGIPVVEYTSPAHDDWLKDTRDQSDRTGVPLGEIRKMRATEGQKAAAKTVQREL